MGQWNTEYQLMLVLETGSAESAGTVECPLQHLMDLFWTQREEGADKDHLNETAVRMASPFLCEVHVKISWTLSAESVKMQSLSLGAMCRGKAAQMTVGISGTR